jgi:GH35 family endo-1,4-beta-xylanase
MTDLIKQLGANIFSENPEIDARIEHGIELYRKGTVKVILRDQAWRPVENAQIEFKQISHEYDFGCNGFLYKQFAEDEKNEAYEKAFAEVFNLVVIPFLWGDLEPIKGEPRFGKNSPKCWRRPAVDDLLEWAEANNIRSKGHPLMGQYHLPHWLQEDETLKAQWEEHFTAIAERYGKRIHSWDVVNEAVCLDHGCGKVPQDHVAFAFDLARKLLPESSRLNYNENACWRNIFQGYTPLYLLVKNLLLQGKKVDCLGLQYHLIGPQPENMVENWCNERLNQEVLCNAMDQYAKLGIPFCLSEVTITGHEAFGPDRFEFQARLAERLYKIWFSQQASNGIVYWNLVDDTAFVDPNPANQGWNENIYKGGLLNNDATLSPKPIYNVIKNLINNEWNSSGVLDYSGRKNNYIRGFYGHYALEIKTDSGVFHKNVFIGKETPNKIEIALS